MGISNAGQPGPESCGGAREDAVEAFTEHRCPAVQSSAGLHPQAAYSTRPHYPTGRARPCHSSGTPQKTLRYGTADPYAAAQRKNKVYSVHEPKVCCIAKGNAGKKYELGNKASVATTRRGGWILGTANLPGNPYDRAHPLSTTHPGASDGRAPIA